MCVMSRPRIHLRSEGVDRLFLLFFSDERIARDYIDSRDFIRLRLTLIQMLLSDPLWSVIAMARLQNHNVDSHSDEITLLNL